MLLQRPSLALDPQPPYRFASLRQPGIELLTEPIALVNARPEISTGALLRARQRESGLDEADKAGLRDLLQARLAR